MQQMGVGHRADDSVAEVEGGDRQRTGRSWSKTSFHGIALAE
jgi:hypothetical protein